MNICNMVVHWKVRFLGGAHTKSVYRGRIA